MRRLLLLSALSVAALAPVAPASATHCEFEYKGVKVCVCLTASGVYREVTGDQLHCA